MNESVDKYFDNDSIKELDEIFDSYINNKNNENISYRCPKCSKNFASEYLLTEHSSIHNIEIENKVCICNKCLTVFESDYEYLSHKINCKDVIIKEIPTDEFGKYPCPTCDKKYSNSFYLGEHFIKIHTDYEELKTLDNNNPIGFPGFDILEKINMIELIYDDLIENCKICHFSIELDIFVDKLSNENRNPLLLKCCNKKICHSCLKNHLSINNNLVCPFCLKDHTQDTYVTYIEESFFTDRDKWIPWWQNHLSIFY